MDQFDNLVAESFQFLAPRAADFELATGYIKHFATRLRAGDALHLAIASNHGLRTVYTLDHGLLEAAKLLKVYREHIAVPWRPNLAGIQRVIFAVHDPHDEPRMRACKTPRSMKVLSVSLTPNPSPACGRGGLQESLARLAR